MKKNTYAIMLTFQKREQLTDGLSGTIPVRILIPNVSQEDSKVLNQYYRILYWYLKSKFEAIDTGLVEFAEEFMPHLVLKDKQGFVTRIWDSFKKGYYRSLGSGEQGNIGLLPPTRNENES